jgi:hypothetical protein
MDGRVQLPAIGYLQKRFNADYVDSITEAGPNLILSEEKNIIAIKAIFSRLKISVEHHHSVGIAIVGHHDCAGNPASREHQLKHIKKAMKVIHQRYENIEIIGLWIDRAWQVHEVGIENF